MPVARLLPLLLLSACSDQAITVINANPEATITSHRDGDVVSEGVLFAIRGTVSDPDHLAEDLVATWFLDAQEVCPSAAPDAWGQTTCELTLTDDYQVVVLEVFDPEGAAGSDQVSLVRTRSTAPSVEILEPVAEGVYYDDQLITFQGQVSDVEDDPDQLTAWWESSLQGTLDLDITPDSQGEVLGFGYLEQGEHALVLTAQDSSDKTGSDSVIIQVGPPNSSPDCGITAPTTGSMGQQGEAVTFEGWVEDIDVSADWLSVTWSSDKDGDFGTSTPASSGDVVYTYSDLTLDTHTITMTAEDEVGATCTDYIVYTVGAPPSVTISSPTSGDIFEEGEHATFLAQVSDTEDAAIDLSIEWSSSLDGVFDTSAADSSGQTLFTYDGLQAGNHSITVTVTDSDGLYSTDVVSITVEACTDLWYADADGDGYGDASSVTTGCSQPTGYVADSTDCDDSDASVHPGATEVCDGVDNDCDGAVDESGSSGASTWYLDADGDGYGDASSSTTACSQPTGYVADGTDCDDTDSTVYPGATELCDGLDNDCDGTVDEAAGSTWYLDADGDGYGDASSSTTACSAPTGYVADDTDCDDTDAAVYPGAAEYCNGYDDDCDGAVDESSAVDATEWFADADGDGYGDATSSTWACSAPTGYVADDTDCDDGDANTYPGATEICDGYDNDCDGILPADEYDTDGDGTIDCLGTTCTTTGMAWEVMDSDSSLSAVRVGCLSCDPYYGETDCNEFHPILCLYDAGLADPGLYVDYYEGWSGGYVEITSSIQGCALTSLAVADAYCASELGTGYVMAEFHDGGGGWSWWGYSSITSTDRFWTYIDDQPANCWD